MRQGLGEDNGIGLIVSYNDIALSLDRLGRLSEARTVFGEALATASERVDPSHPTLLAVRQNHAAILRAEGRLEEARTEYRTLTAAWESAGVDLPVKAVTGQAWVDALLGEPVRAEEALRGLEARITEEESYYWMVRAVLGESLRLQGRYDEARTVLEASLEPSVRVMGPDYEGTQLIRRALREIELRDPS